LIEHTARLYHAKRWPEGFVTAGLKKVENE
jgi:hypothetical protein